jgi:hypothetical protein
MFVFQRDGTKCQVRVDTGLKESDRYPTPIFPHVWECGNEWTAILLVKHLWKRFHEWKTTIRTESYRQGWADAKAKRTKLY